MKRLLFIFLLIPGALFAQKIQKDSIFILEGSIDQPSKSSKVYLIYQTEGKRIIDSSVIYNHQFRFKGVVPDPLFATLAFDQDGKGLKKLFSKFADEIDMLHLYLHPGNIRLIAKDSIATAVFTVSGINQDYSHLKALLGIAGDRRLTQLSAIMLREKTTTAGDKYETFYDSLKLARHPVLKKFAVENPSSYIALMALQEYAGAFPDAAEIRPLFDALAPAVKNTTAGQNFNTLLNSEKELAPGAFAPDFTQNDTSGRPVSLYSFRGKYVLIDFWASWCASCRENNPSLVKIYNELKGKNFTILGVSLDSRDTREAWLQAITHDGLTWPQISDLNHWDNTVIKEYGINAIPQNVFVGPDGRIIAKNIAVEDIRNKINQAE